MNKTALQVKSREFAIIQTYAEATINKSSSETKKRSMRKIIVFKQSESRNAFMKRRSWCEQWILQLFKELKCHAQHEKNDDATWYDFMLKY